MSLCCIFVFDMFFDGKNKYTLPYTFRVSSSCFETFKSLILINASLLSRQNSILLSRNISIKYWNKYKDEVSVSYVWQFLTNKFSPYCFFFFIYCNVVKITKHCFSTGSCCFQLNNQWKYDGC